MNAKLGQSSRHQTIRELALLLLGIVLVAAGLPLSKFLLDHGYLDWVQYVPERVIQGVVWMMFVVFATLVISLIVAVERQRRVNPRRPGYVKLLSGYRGPRASAVAVRHAAMSLSSLKGSVSVNAQDCNVCNMIGWLHTYFCHGCSAA